MKIYKLYSSVSRDMMEEDVYIKDFKKALRLFYENIDNLKKDHEYLSDKSFISRVDNFKEDIKYFNHSDIEILDTKNPYIIYKRNNDHIALIYFTHRDEFYSENTYEVCCKVTLEEVEVI